MQAVPQELVPNRVGEQIREDISKERTLDSTPIVDMPVPQKRISDRTLIADVPVLATLGTFFQERISERMHGQIVHVPVPYVALQGRTRSAYTSRPSIYQVTKHAEIPQIQYIDKAVDMLVVMQRQVPRIQTARKTVEVPLAQSVGTVLRVSVITQVITKVRQVTKHVEFPQTQHIDKIVEVLAVTQRQVPQVQTVPQTVAAVAYVEACAVHRRLQDTVCVSSSATEKPPPQTSEILAKAQCRRTTAKLRRGTRRCSLEHIHADARDTCTVGQHLRDVRLGRKGRAAEAALRLRPAAAGDGAGVRRRRLSGKPPSLPTPGDVWKKGRQGGGLGPGKDVQRVPTLSCLSGFSDRNFWSACMVGTARLFRSHLDCRVIMRQ